MEASSRYTPRINYLSWNDHPPTGEGDFAKPDPVDAIPDPNSAVGEGSSETLSQKLANLHLVIEQAQKETQKQIQDLLTQRTRKPKKAKKAKIEKIISAIDARLTTYQTSFKKDMELGSAPELREVIYEHATLKSELGYLSGLTDGTAYRLVPRTLTHSEPKEEPELDDESVDGVLVEESVDGELVEENPFNKLSKYNRELDDLYRRLDAHARTLRKFAKNPGLLGRVTGELHTDQIFLTGCFINGISAHVRDIEAKVFDISDQMSQEALDAYHLHADRAKEKAEQLTARHHAFEQVFSSRSGPLFQALDKVTTIFSKATPANALEILAKVIEPLCEARSALKQIDSTLPGHQLAQQELDVIKAAFNKAYKQYVEPLADDDFKKQILSIHYKNVNDSKAEVLQAIAAFETSWNNLEPKERDQAFLDDYRFRDMFYAYTQQYYEYCMPIRDNQRSPWISWEEDCSSL